MQLACVSQNYDEEAYNEDGDNNEPPHYTGQNIDKWSQFLKIGVELQWVMPTCSRNTSDNHKYKQY